MLPAPLPYAAVYDREAVLYRHSSSAEGCEESHLLCSSPCGKYIALCPASGEPALLFDVASSSSSLSDDASASLLLSPPMRLDTAGSRILAAACSGGSGSFAGARKDGGIYLSTAYGLPARFIPATDSNLPATAPLSLAFDSPKGEALLALYPDGRVFALPLGPASSSPPAPRAPLLVADAASAGSAACCMAVDAEGKFLLLAGPGAESGGEASSSVRASLWRFDRRSEEGSPPPSSSFALDKVAATGKPRPRSWLPPPLLGAASRAPTGWRAVFADESGCCKDDGAGGPASSSAAPRPPPRLLAAVAPGGQAPPSLFVASPVSLSKLELFPASCVRDASSAAWWGSDVVVVVSSLSGTPSAAVAALAPPSGACVLASSTVSSSSVYEQLTPLMSRKSEHGTVQRVALLLRKEEEGGSEIMIAARERLPPAAAAAAAAAAGDWATACSVAAADPSAGGWFARRADAVVHLPRWRAVCRVDETGNENGGFPGGASAEAAAVCLAPLRSRRAAVAAALSAVSAKGDAAVQRGLIDWALREIALHWPGGNDDDDDDDNDGVEKSEANDLDGGEVEALALAASSSGFPRPPPSPAPLWPLARLPSHLWWASAKRAALRHAERLGTVSSSDSSSSSKEFFDRAAFAALRDADLVDVAGGVCAAGAQAAAAALRPLLRLHPRAMFSVPTTVSSASASATSASRSLPIPLPPALAALSSLPETTPAVEVVSLLRLVVEASKEAPKSEAGAAVSNYSIDACERAAVTAALEAAGASGRADLFPTEAAIAGDSPPLTGEQVAAWACARALAVDARTGQLAAAAALLDAVATLLVDGAGGDGKSAAESVAALAEAARELSAAAAASAVSSPVDDTSSGGDEEDEDEEDEDEEEEESPRSPPSVLADAWAVPLAAFASAPPLERARVLLGGGVGGRKHASSSAAAARERAAASLSRSIPSQEGRDEAAAALLLSLDGSGSSNRASLLRRALRSAAGLAAAEAADLRLFSSHERLAAACVSAVYSLDSSSSSSVDLWGPALALLHIAWRPLRAAEAERRLGERAEERRRRREEREEKKRLRRKGKRGPSFVSVAEEGEGAEEGQDGSGDADGWEDSSIASAPKDEEEEGEEGEEQEEEEEEEEEEESSSENSAASSEDEGDDYHFFDAAPPPTPGSALSEVARVAAACRAAALLRSRRLGGQLCSAAEIRDATARTTSATSATAAVSSFVAAAVAALRGPPLASDAEWVEASADLEDVRAAVEAFAVGEDEEETRSSSSSPVVVAPLAAGALAACRWRAAKTLLASLPFSLASSVALAAGVEHLKLATSLSDDSVAHAQQCLGLAPGEGGADSGDRENGEEEDAQQQQRAAHARLSSARRALAALRRLADFGVDVSSPALFLDPGSGDAERMEAIEAVVEGWRGAPREPGAVLRLAEDLGVVGAVPTSLMARQYVSAEEAAVAAASLDPRRVRVLVALGEAALRSGDADAAAARAAEAASAVSSSAASSMAACDAAAADEALERATEGAWRLAAAAADALLDLAPPDDDGDDDSKSARRRASRSLRAFALAFAPPGDALADLVFRWDQARAKARKKEGEDLLSSRLRRAVEDPWCSSSPAAPLLVSPLASRWPRGSLPAGRPLPSCGDASAALSAVLALGPSEGAAALAAMAASCAATADANEEEEEEDGGEQQRGSSPSPLPPAGARVAALLGAFHAGLLLSLLSQQQQGDISSLLDAPPLELWASASAAAARSTSSSSSSADETTLLLLSAGAAAEKSAVACSSDRALRAALPGVDAAKWRLAGARGKAYRASALAAGAAAAARAPPETRRAQPPPLERLVALAARTDSGDHRWAVAATYACELLVSLGEGGGSIPPSADDPLVRAARDELRSLRRRCGERPAEWGKALMDKPWRALSAGNAPQMALWLSSAEDAERGRAKLLPLSATGGGGGDGGGDSAATSFATAATNASSLSFPPSLLSSSPSAAADALAALRKALGLASRVRPGLDTRALAAPAVEAALGGSSSSSVAGEQEDGGEEVDQQSRASESLSSTCGVDSPAGPSALSAAGVLFRAATELACEAASSAAETQRDGDGDASGGANTAVAALQDLARAVDALPVVSPTSTTPGGDAVRLAAACRLLSLSLSASSSSASASVSADDAYDLAVAAAAGCSAASAAALARFALGAEPPREVVAGFGEAVRGGGGSGGEEDEEDSALWFPSALPSELPMHVRARAAADGEAASRSSSYSAGDGSDDQNALSLALAADELAAAGARARALCALRDGGARLGDADVAAAAEAMESGSAEDAPLRALARRGVGFARLAAAARALGIPGAAGGEFAATGAALASVLDEAALFDSDESDEEGEASAASAVRGVMTSLAAPAPTAPAGALASARDAIWELLLSLSSGEKSCSVAALEALSSLAAANDAATSPWRGWRPPPASSAAASLDLVRLAALSSAAVAKGAAAGKKAKKAGCWRFAAADVASAERAASAFHRLLLLLQSREEGVSPSLVALGGLLAEVWLDGRVFPAAVAVVEGVGESNGAPPAPLPLSSSAVPPLISSCYRSLLVEMLSRGDAPAALRVADAAAARGATLLPEAEDALAVCRSVVSAAAAEGGEERDAILLAGASLGALLAPLEASAEQVASAAAAGAAEAAAASAALSVSSFSSVVAPLPSFDAASAAASLVSALVARGSVVELSALDPGLLDNAFGRLLTLAIPEIDGREGGSGGGEHSRSSDWRSCALPAATACLASAGSVELAAGLAAAHTRGGQSSSTNPGNAHHLSACLPLLRLYLRALVLPALCDPASAAGIAARLSAPAPAPGAMAAVWRGLPGAATAALRVLDESED